MADDITILRELVSRYTECAAKPVQQQRRNLWRAHNSLKRTSVPIYVRAFAWHEMPESQLQCADAFWHPIEGSLRNWIFRDSFNDDFILEPWLTVPAVRLTPGEGLWGLPVKWTGRTHTTAGICEPALKDAEDISKLVVPRHVVDKDATTAKVTRVREALGDLITVTVDRAPLYVDWNADISTRIAELRGLEQIMWDMMDRPQWLHQLLTFMRDGIMKAHREAEEAGDWRLCDHQNQAMPYAEELDDPTPGGQTVPRKTLWTFCASQETTSVGPAMFEEFMLQYQIPIVEQFGLTAYGCCEDLTHKIDSVRKIPNLRRIAVSPMANAAACAEQIGADYVLSYRPSPSDMVGYGFDPDRITRILTKDLEACRDCIVDITLKDVETVQGDPSRIRKWVALARRAIEEVGL